MIYIAALALIIVGICAIVVGGAALVEQRHSLHAPLMNKAKACACILFGIFFVVAAVLVSLNHVSDLEHCKDKGGKVVLDGKCYELGREVPDV